VTDRDYSGTPLWRKLGIRERNRIALVGAPKGLERALRPLPHGASVLGRPTGRLDVVVLFAERRADLTRRLPRIKRMLDAAGGLWVAYPKKASGVETDIDFGAVQDAGLDAGLVDNKSCSIDDVWTAVRFVYRLEDR